MFMAPRSIYERYSSLESFRPKVVFKEAILGVMALSSRLNLFC